MHGPRHGETKGLQRGCCENTNRTYRLNEGFARFHQGELGAAVNLNTDGVDACFKIRIVTDCIVQQVQEKNAKQNLTSSTVMRLLNKDVMHCGTNDEAVDFLPSRPLFPSPHDQTRPSCPKATP